MSDNESPNTGDCDREEEPPSIAEALFDLCTSDELSITALHETINNPGLSTNYKNSFNRSYGMYKDKSLFVFHYACMNENVTLEIIEFLLNNNIRSFPDAVQVLSTEFATKQGDRHPSISETYPLHIACSNDHCPSDVIRFLIEQYPPALKHVSNINGGVHSDAYQVAGLPLHYYLARNKNVDINTIKVLVEAYPQSILIPGYEYYEEDAECYPIHALLSNEKTNNLHTIVEYILELEPSSIRLLDGCGRALPLHVACRNGNMRLEVVQFIFNKWPEAIRTRDHYDGWLPVHELCYNQKLDDIVALEILQFMLGIDPTLVRERNDHEELPLHYAVMVKSTTFCKVLIDAHPESLRIDSDGCLPIHEACRFGRYDTVEMIQYMLDIYPVSINARDFKGRLPIHCAAMHGRTETIKLLLKYDPNAASKKTEDEKQSLPLHTACQYCKQLEAIQVLYDAFPEATMVLDVDGKAPSQLVPVKEDRSKVFKFFSDQFDYIKKLNDTAAMITPNEIGWLPLHRALKDNVSLGTIKLMVKKCPATVRMADNRMAFPLHVACEFSSVKVVRYLIEEHDGIPIHQLDTIKDSVLHYACHGGNLDVVKYLMTNHSSLVSSAEENGNGELPIHLLCEAGKDKVKVDCDSAEYVETIWLMLLANPEVIMS